MPERTTSTKLVVLVANSRDFATDYVVAELRDRGIEYVRLDLDLLAQDTVSLDPVIPQLEASTPQGKYCLSAGNVAGILFRAPTHLAESGADRYSPEEQLSRHQWAAFARGLTVFDTVNWVNHPTQTYAAESKPFQLRIASRLGWTTAPTRITNVRPPDYWPVAGEPLAVKALDTFFVRFEEQDAFFYTQPVERTELSDSNLRAMPVILQQYLRAKLDLRVTVVGNKCLAAAVVSEGAGVEGDWRLQKEVIDYRPYDLPADVEKKCVEMVRACGLVFGAVDLACVHGQYFFLEVNPTGEWAWLTERLGFPIPSLLVDALVGSSPRG